MMQHYQPTILEEWVADWYGRLGIREPSQLHYETFSEKLGLQVFFMEMASQTVKHNGRYAINIDSRCSKAEQWEHFLHELCHIARHCGNQTALPAEFIHWQEQEADRFVPYAAIPYFMLDKLDLPDQTTAWLERLVQVFGVTRRLASARMEQLVRRRIPAFWNGLDSLRAVRPDKPRQWSPQTMQLLDKLERRTNYRKEP